MNHLALERDRRSVDRYRGHDVAPWVLLRYPEVWRGVGGAWAAAVEATSRLRDEWRSSRATLHGYHHAEDTGVFPNLAREYQTLRRTIERLTEDHRRIDPLIDRGVLRQNAIQLKSWTFSGWVRASPKLIDRRGSLTPAYRTLP
ncbi:MAG TPA: hypothetical protein VFG23_14675 [Polyangia bacterium]|nr:hypothetical protein [Polyangia bacterium]